MDVAGTAPATTDQPQTYGIEFTGTVKSDVVGGKTAQYRNVVSGNTGDGIFLNGSGHPQSNSRELHRHQRSGDEGSDGRAEPRVPAGPADRYLREERHAQHHRRHDDRRGNVIAGNIGDGVYVNSGAMNVVEYDDIGTEADGSTLLLNARWRGHQSAATPRAPPSPERSTAP